MAVVAFVVFIMSLLAINITSGYLDTNTESISDYMSLTIAFKLGTSCVPAMGINWLLKFAMFAEHKGTSAVVYISIVKCEISKLFP